MKLLSCIPFVAVILGSIHLVIGSELEAESSLSMQNLQQQQTSPSQKQVCGGHKWFTEHPCPAGRQARFNGHWDCCTFLTEVDKEKTAQRRAKVAKKHDTATEHGRCLGKAYLAESRCHFSDSKMKEFTHPKLNADRRLWDCCKSLTSDEQNRVSKFHEAAKKACHGYGFEYEDKPFVVWKHSCEKGKYAKKRDANSNWKYRSDLLCCPEFTDEEKRIGDQQRWEASEEVKQIEKKLAKMRADDADERARRERNRKLCESSHYGYRTK